MCFASTSMSSFSFPSPGHSQGFLLFSWRRMQFLSLQIFFKSLVTKPHIFIYFSMFVIFSISLCASSHFPLTTTIFLVRGLSCPNMSTSLLAPANNHNTPNRLSSVLLNSTVCSTSSGQPLALSRIGLLRLLRTICSAAQPVCSVGSTS